MQNDLEILMENVDHRLSLIGKSRSWLADQAGFERSNFTHWAAGKGNPSLNLITKMAAVLKCATYDLLRPKNAALGENGYSSKAMLIAWAYDHVQKPKLGAVLQTLVDSLDLPLEELRAKWVESLESPSIESPKSDSHPQPQPQATRHKYKP